MLKDDLATALKGFAMGAANVVPGVSGGTIAFITGIYERLIEALKAFDLTAVHLALKFKFAELWVKLEARFLLSLGIGIILAFATLARVLKWGFTHQPELVFALFFGLILASIPSVGKMIRKWNPPVLVAFSIGLAIAASIAFLNPASENSNPLYLGLCGVVAMCSMIIPGLSGSFVLLLMGNYELIMLDSLSALFSGDFKTALPILIPVGVGAILGLLLLSRFLSWLFKAHHDNAVSVITGFVTGSLVIIWPWKTTVMTTVIDRHGDPKEKIVGFKDWTFPDLTLGATWLALGAVVLGGLLIFGIERVARKNQTG